MRQGPHPHFLLGTETGSSPSGELCFHSAASEIWWNTNLYLMPAHSSSPYTTCPSLFLSVLPFLSSLCTGLASQTGATLFLPLWPALCHILSKGSTPPRSLWLLLLSHYLMIILVNFFWSISFQSGVCLIFFPSCFAYPSPQDSGHWRPFGWGKRGALSLNSTIQLQPGR